MGWTQPHTPAPTDLICSTIRGLDRAIEGLQVQRRQLVDTLNQLAPASQQEADDPAGGGRLPAPSGVRPDVGEPTPAGSTTLREAMRAAVEEAWANREDDTDIPDEVGICADIAVSHLAALQEIADAASEVGWDPEFRRPAWEETLFNALTKVRKYAPHAAERS